VHDGGDCLLKPESLLRSRSLDKSGLPGAGDKIVPKKKKGGRRQWGKGKKNRPGKDRRAVEIFNLNPN